MKLFNYIKNMWSLQKEQTVYFVIFLALMFFLPLYKISSSPFLILFALISVFKIIQSRGKLLKQVFQSKLKILFVLFFSIYALSLFYSENKTHGLDQINKLLPFVLFPVVFSYYKPDRAAVVLLLKTFVLAGVVAFVLSISSQVYFYAIGQNYSFYYLDFIAILWMHPTYLSLYLNFGILAMYYLYTQKEVSFLSLSFIAVLFVFFILLLFARMQIIIMFLSLLLIVAHLLYKNWNLKKGILLMLFALGAVFFIAQNKKLSNRFKYIQNLNYDYTQTKNWNGANVRLAIWNSATDVIKENLFFGVGVGDEDDALLSAYKKNGFMFAYDLNYVAHNQFIQVLLATGLLGFIVYILFYVYVFYQAFYYKNLLLFSLGFILLATGLTESFLRMQSGLVFFVVIIFLTLHLENTKAE